MLREKVYAVLEEYTKTTYPGEFSRFPQLLLRLPALRSIGLRCLDHLFFCKVWKKQFISQYFFLICRPPRKSGLTMKTIEVIERLHSV